MYTLCILFDYSKFFESFFGLVKPAHNSYFLLDNPLAPFWWSGVDLVNFWLHPDKNTYYSVLQNHLFFYRKIA